LTDTGAANAYVVANLSAFTAYPTVSGLIIDVSILNANTGASTLNVDGLGTKPILGLGLQPLQGGELVVKGVACLMYVVASTVNSGNGAWIVMECTGGAQQIAAGTQSNHAVNLGQFALSNASAGYQKLPSGLIIQWGTFTTSSSADVGVTFPIAFPNACLSACYSNNTNTSFGEVGASASPSKTGFNAGGWQSAGRVAIGALYIAIGY
jgi:hypothetical protein